MMAGRIIATSFFLGVIGVILSASSPDWPKLRTSLTEAAFPASCAASPKKHPDLAKSADAQLRKLAEYEQLCNGSVASELMVFAAMPTTFAEADTFAKTVATQLKAFSSYGVAPLVIFEPSATRPAILSEIRRGMYDTVLDSYYKKLKAYHVTDAQMGTWVLFPEANTPAWKMTSPSDFAANVTIVARLQKRHFPTSKTSLLLDSHSYQMNDDSWSTGKVAGLEPYVQAIPKGLIDRFGLQGFPWVTPGRKITVAQLTAETFLPARLASGAAARLGVKDIWLNTGTFRCMYVNVPSQRVCLSEPQRQLVLSGIAGVAHTLSAQSFKVSVNIFAENKAATSEGVDWSYWHARGPHEAGSHAAVLDAFIRQLHTQGNKFSLFDTF